MRDGFRSLIIPSTLSSEIDIEGTREKRDLLRAELRERQELLDRLMELEAPNDQ